MDHDWNHNFLCVHCGVSQEFAVDNKIIQCSEKVNYLMRVRCENLITKLTAPMIERIMEKNLDQL